MTKDHYFETKDGQNRGGATLRRTNFTNRRPNAIVLGLSLGDLARVVGQALGVLNMGRYG